MDSIVRTVTLVLGVLSALAATSAQAQELGRLFTTPAQRAMLERLRHAPPPVQTTPPVVVIEPAQPTVPAEVLPPPMVPPVTVMGVVLRSNGEGTAWVNGENTYEGDFSRQNIKVDGPRSLAVPIDTPAHLPDVRLKPGQTYDPATNTIVDVYQQSR